MARPIKETPELTGKDAVRFETLITNPKLVSSEISSGDSFDVFRPQKLYILNCGKILRVMSIIYA